MSFQLLRAGGPLSVQDGGRPGLAHLGIPPGGWADPASARLANALVGNRPAEPTLEWALAGPTLRFRCAAVVAAAGADAELRIDGTLVPALTRLRVGAGQTLRIGPVRRGRFGYLAVGGRWDVPRWRGSACAISVGEAVLPQGARPVAGSSVEVVGPGLPAVGRVGATYVRPPDRRAEAASAILDFWPAPDAGELWRGYGLSEWLSRAWWRVDAASNRVGYRLTGARWPRRVPASASARSAPVRPGTLQLLPSGELLVLGPDGPTVGGYPRVGWVVASAVSQLATVLLRPV